MTSRPTSRLTIGGSKNKPLHAIRLAAFLVGAVLAAGPANSEWVGGAQAHMGTEVSVYLWHDDAGTAKNAVDAIFAEVARLDRLMST